MRDREIVALLVSGDRAEVRRGLEAAYTAYADRLHDYARSMLRSHDPASAADVLHDTFLIAAAKAPDLRDPDRFRSWLYAITRNECLRVLRATKRHDPLEHDATPHPALVAADAEGSPDMVTDLSQNDLRELVHAAAAGLSPKEHEVFDLGMRHDLAVPEIAQALRVSENAAHAMLSRVRAQFSRSLGALQVARTGREACPALDALLTGWDGTYDALWRKRVARHIDECAMCSVTQARELSPSALLGLLPLLGAPVLVRDRLFSDDLDLVAAGRPLVHRAGPFDREGFPGEVATRRRPVALALLGVLVLLGGLVVLGWFTRDARFERDAQAVPTTQVNSDGLFSSSSPPAYVVQPGGTLTPVPTTATTSPTVSISPTTTPTTTIPTVAPTSTPTKTSAPTTAPPSSPPSSTPTSTPPASGTLRVEPTSVHLPRSGGTGTVRITAVGGPVDWTATRRGAAATWTSLSSSSGSLAAGSGSTVTITVAPVTDRSVTTLVIEFDPGSTQVTITLV
jgi:RNA polymerase sigma factor (sigma-70 family)